MADPTTPRPAAEKKAYIVVKGNVNDDDILGAFSNPSDAMDFMLKKQKESGERASCVKFVMPKGATRQGGGPKKKKAA